jgi:PAS domain S-box-containing protein
MRSPALWLYLLGAVTVLSVVLRRVLRRQTPLNDDLYAKQVAIDHVRSGVAWVRADGLIGFINPAFAKTVGLLPREILNKPWLSFFPMGERRRVEEAYSQALLMGKTTLETQAQRPNGTLARVNILLVTVHDHKSRLVGHYCMLEDQTREVELEEQIQRLSAQLPSIPQSRDSLAGAPSSPLW